MAPEHITKANSLRDEAERLFINDQIKIEFLNPSDSDDIVTSIYKSELPVIVINTQEDIDQLNLLMDKLFRISSIQDHIKRNPQNKDSAINQDGDIISILNLEPPNLIFQINPSLNIVDSIKTQISRLADGIIIGDQLDQNQIYLLKLLGLSRKRSTKAESIAQTLPIIAQELDLKQFESLSSDTLTTMVNLFELVQKERIKDQEDYQVLEVGVGAGRIAILLKFFGIHVTGIDVTQSRLDDIPRRFLRTLAEYQILISEYGYPDGEIASFNDLIDREIGFNEKLLLKTIIQLEFNGYQIDQRMLELNPNNEFTGLREFGAEQLINIGIHNHMVQFIPTKGQIPLAILAWNTLNFLGSPEELLRTLVNIRQSLQADGLLYIEIPDITTGAYPTILQEMIKNNKDNPHYLPGTMAQAPSTDDQKGYTNEKKAASRYFMSTEELTSLLELAGFEVETKSRGVVPGSENLNRQNPLQEVYITARKRL